MADLRLNSIAWYILLIASYFWLQACQKEVEKTKKQEAQTG